MVNLKATVRVKTTSGLYPVYIRFTKSNQVSYVKTSWVVNEKGLGSKKDIFCNLPDDVENSIEASYKIKEWQ